MDGGCNYRRCKTEEEVVAFLDQLVTLAETYPESALALSHAVYAAVKYGYIGRAENAVASCAVRAAYMCDLAAGFMRHTIGDFASADSLFERAIEAMPESLRCAIEDIRFLLPSEMADEYVELPCDSRSDVHRWFWWSSDPFLIDAANDRWTEHVTRWFRMMMVHDIDERLDERLPRRIRNVFEEPHHSYFVRRGHADSNEQSSSAVARVGFTGYYWMSRAGAYNHFVPESLLLDGLPDNLEYRLESRIEYVGPGANRWGPGDEGYTRAGGIVVEVPVQTARFREADSIVVALASDLTAAVGAAVGQAYFVASEGPGHVVGLEPSSLRETVRFAGKLANRKQVVGVEVFTPGPDARHRAVLQPLDTAEHALSDLLLFQPEGSERPGSRIEAVARMYGSTRVPQVGGLGIYWETYGLSEGEAVRIRLRVEKQGGGFLSGLAKSLGLAGEEAGGTLTWTETVGGEGPFVQALTLDLGSAGTGEYELVVEVEGADGMRLTRSRSFEVIG